jgi:hypothetical protein
MSQNTILLARSEKRGSHEATQEEKEGSLACRRLPLSLSVGRPGGGREGEPRVCSFGGCVVGPGLWETLPRSLRWRRVQINSSGLRSRSGEASAFV